jgi:REP-associated tyrosine transposase
MNEKLPERKLPVHLPPVSSHNRLIIIFLTVCTEKRKPILARDDVHQVLLASWQSADKWVVGRYVVMPDHVHMVCAPNSVEPVTLERWIHFWKSQASRRWPRPGEQPVWQKSFWDSQLRRTANYEDKWNYVRQNPVRHGLVTSAEQWPYQGELSRLEWRD